jgi:molybdopterin-guanine dinucleotide biosynthesis protein A
VTWAAVILAGGRGSRLGNVEKASLESDGRSLLDHALAAVAAAAEVVVVGDPVPTSTPTRFVREEPVGSGPLAAASAGVSALTGTSDLVIVLAVDMPGVTAQTVSRLLEAAAHGDGAWLTDAAGRRQAAGAVRPAVIARLTQEDGDLAGRPLRLLLEAPGTVAMPAVDREADDVDTWEDVARWRGLDDAQTGGPDPL